jgi:hypothetical protein
MTRIAHCCCLSLRTETTGEPVVVAACYCVECQRGTGSPFGVNIYYLNDPARTEGQSKVCVRGINSGRKIELHFRPECDSGVFRYAKFFRDLTGTALGAIADPSMPWPTVFAWEKTQPPWLTFDHDFDRFGDQMELTDDPSRHAGERWWRGER